MRVCSRTEEAVPAVTSNTTSGYLRAAFSLSKFALREY